MSTADTTIGNTAQSYGTVAKTFHWLTALLILTAIPLGLIANNWSYDTSAQLATKGWLFSLHKTIGLSAFLVAVMRIAWAVFQPKPALLHPDRRIESWAADTAHWMLYASMIIVPLSGWLHHAATSGFAPIWWPFGQSLPFVPVSDPVAHFFAAWHWLFTKVLVATILLHVVGALKHHFIDQDQTLARMLPGVTRAGASGGAHSALPLKTASGLWVALIAAGSLLGLSSDASQTPAVPQLQAEPSGWTVQDGRLGITATQLGSEVEGQFGEWSAAINFDADTPGAVKGDVTVEIAISSLTLGSVTSEALKPEFFAAEDYPTAQFVADIVEVEGSEGYTADGTLTLKGTEMPLALPFTLNIDGDTARMEAQTVIDRRDFGIGTTSYSDEATVAHDVTVNVGLTALRSDTSE